jgi:hypothetical protein
MYAVRSWRPKPWPHTAGAAPRLYYGCLAGERYTESGDQRSLGVGAPMGSPASVIENLEDRASAEQRSALVSTVDVIICANIMTANSLTMHLVWCFHRGDEAASAAAGATLSFLVWRTVYNRHLKREADGQFT